MFDLLTFNSRKIMISWIPAQGRDDTGGYDPLILRCCDPKPLCLMPDVQSSSPLIL